MPRPEKLSMLLLAGCLLAGPAAFCQPVLADALNRQVIQPYSAHFGLKREVFYIQANKALFYPGESLAFKVYVSDARYRKPFLETANIYIELFGPAGERVAQQVIYAEGGSAPGTLLLPATLKPGNYGLRAYTAWSRNFGGDEAFVLPLQVLGKEAAPVAAPVGGQELGIYPEGGTFIEEVPARFGLKLSGAGGLGIAATLEISMNGRPYRNVSTNELGFASIALTACADDSIVASWVQPDGVRKAVPFPRPLARGVSLAVPVRAPGDPLVVSLRTNGATLPGLGEQKFYLLLHRQGMVSKLHWVSFVNRRDSIGLTFPAGDFTEGVTHVTLFGPGLKPVADRAVYIAPSVPAPKVEARLSGWKDSIRVELRSSNGTGAPVAASLSLSVLPEGTRADGFRSALFARELLEQETGGFAERPLYYFPRRDSVRAAALDELLLVQGWRRYDWNAILDSPAPPARFPFEQGFTIQGRVNGRGTYKGKARRELVLTNPRQQLFLKTGVDSAGTFRFERVFLPDPAKLSLLTTDSRSTGLYRNLSIDSAHTYFNPERPRLPLRGSVAVSGAGEGIAGEELPEVIISKAGYGKGSVAEQLKPASERAYRFSDNDRGRYFTLKDYLKTRYNLREFSWRDPASNLDKYHVAFSLSNSITLPSDPVLVIDGVQVSDMEMLGRISLQDLESVSVNTRGSTEVPFGSGGHIIVKTRSPLDDGDGPALSNVVKELLLQGYRLPAAHYRPAYRMAPGSAAFESFACLYWAPDIATDSGGRCTFMIPNPDGRKAVRIILEGKGRDGEGFYRRERVAVEE